MKLPIDTTGMNLLGASPAEPVIDFESKRQRVDENGQPIFQVQLVALGESAAELLQVKVAGEPRGVSQGSPVKVVGLMATPWSMGDRSGVSFRAARIEPVAPATAAPQRSAS